MHQIHAFTPQTTRNGALWWWKFALTSFNLPERLLAGKEREFLTWFYDNGTVNREAVGESTVQEYLRSFAAAEGVYGALGVYRAIFETIDQIEAYTGDHKIRTPILGIGGAHSKGAQVAEQLSQIATRVTGNVIENCGHFPADEQPTLLTEQLLTFFREAKSVTWPA
jgi:pimeloyl-ACP methyl ester carboxylesterase